MLVKSRVLRIVITINHHIISSIRSSLKTHFSMIINHSCQVTGHGNEVNFWLDNWCDIPLVQNYNIPSIYHNSPTIYISNFIVRKMVPASKYQLDFPWFVSIISNFSIPLEEIDDKRTYDCIDSGILTSKHAYDFIVNPRQVNLWNKFP